MSKIRFTIATLAVTSFCGLADAQTTQVLPAQTSPPPVQPVAPAQQPLPQQNGSIVDQADRYESRRVVTDSKQQGPTVKEAILHKLQKANEAEIELAKLAIQKSDNEDVKKLAQTIVQDHEACNEKLQKMTGHDKNSGQGQHAQQDRTTSNQQAGRLSTSDQSPTVPKELCRIAEQACENSLKMTKDMLSKYKGQDFNMAFLGQQCVAHTMMLAELKAIESSGPQELQQMAQEASQKVEQHLEKSKQLAKKLEDDRKNKNSDRS